MCWACQSFPVTKRENDKSTSNDLSVDKRTRAEMKTAGAPWCQGQVTIPVALRGLHALLLCHCTAFTTSTWQCKYCCATGRAGGWTSLQGGSDLHVRHNDTSLVCNLLAFPTFLKAQKQEKGIAMQISAAPYALSIPRGCCQTGKWAQLINGEHKGNVRCCHFLHYQSGRGQLTIFCALYHITFKNNEYVTASELTTPPLC